MKLRNLLIFALIGCSSVVLDAQESLSLKGEWRVKLDPDSAGFVHQYQQQLFEQTIQLPGTTDEACLGRKTTENDYGILTRRYKYYGPAWYSREIEIPDKWKEHSLELYLERVMWESRVWVDGVEVQPQDGLGTPHIHPLGSLKPGKHLLTVCVNNELIHNIGDKGHAYTEYTQTIWNGMVGKIELRAYPQLAIRHFTAGTLKGKNGFTVNLRVENDAKKAQQAELFLVLRDVKSGERIAQSTSLIRLLPGEQILNQELLSSTPLQGWNEFTPQLYEIEAIIKGKKTLHQQTITTGYRTVEHSKSKILVNDMPVFLRGNLDCVHFPITGYPSCEVSEWERIFSIYKSYGLNHVRFHSWCPPEAAFKAADKLGIYIQAEVIWIDWWMTDTPKDRPEMYTKGLPKGLGKNPSADGYVQAELDRMIDAYGHHPSFVMMCIGNELGNSDFEVMQQWMESRREKDSRRLYAVSTARKIMPVDQYAVTHNIPGVGSTYGAAPNGTDGDMEKNYAQASIPVIAHEVGQYPVYPLWSEIDKYTGVVEARNLQGLRELARKNHLEAMNHPFHEASGALQNILYKELMENLFRTPSCAGFQMLSMADYQGQGEALVGWLDPFWDPKSNANPDEYRQYCNEVVPLARFSKYNWKSDEAFSAALQLANYSDRTMNGKMQWRFVTLQGKELGKGSCNVNAPNGVLTSLGTINLALNQVHQAAQCRLEVKLEGTPYHNSWNLWVYPPVELKQEGIYVAESFDEKACEVLGKGGKVFLKASALGTDKSSRPIFFSSLFWSTSFFPGQSNSTLGLYLDPKHSAYQQFPTSFYGDRQWQAISKGRSFVVTDYPELQPIAQPISDFHINEKLASLFECRVGDGQLLVCGYDLKENENIVGKQLLYSLLGYMQSNAFAPKYEIPAEELKKMLNATPKAITSVPKEFEKALLYVACGANVKQNGSSGWNKASDSVFTNGKHIAYRLTKSDDVWRDQHGSAWTARQFEIELETPKGIIGDLYIKFEDWNNQQRKGNITIEGRDYELGSHTGDGTWVKLFVMREDTNDGKVMVKANVKQGGNLMISRMVLMPQ